MGKINDLIAKANSENRDVTDAELNEIKAMRHEIEDRLIAKLKAAQNP